MLGCTSFGNLAVTSFIPRHMALVKGVVRGLHSSGDASELLSQFVDLGAVEVYRCSVVKEGNPIPTESCIVTFAVVH